MSFCVLTSRFYLIWIPCSEFLNPPKCFYVVTEITGFFETVTNEMIRNRLVYKSLKHSDLFSEKQPPPEKPGYRKQTVQPLGKDADGINVLYGRCRDDSEINVRINATFIHWLTTLSPHTQYELRSRCHVVHGGLQMESAWFSRPLDSKSRYFFRLLFNVYLNNRGVIAACFFYENN